MIKRIALLAVVSIVLGGCQQGFSCAGWKRFQVSRADAERTKEQAIAHNSYGREQGCWK